MTNEELVSIIGEKISHAINGEDGDVSCKRQEVFNRYLGNLYGSEREGYSSFTTREVMETVEWALPSLLRMFLGSNRVVAFEAQSAEDERLADQETEVVNYKVLRADKWRRVSIALHNFMKDSLMNPTAYAKVYLEDQDHTVTHHVSGVTQEALMGLYENSEVQITEQSSDTKEVSLMGQKVMIEVFDITYRERVNKRALKIMSVPGEEVLLDSELTSTNPDDAKFVCHRSRRTVTQLIRMGYDKDEITDLPGGGIRYDSQSEEKYNRHFYEDENPTLEGHETDKSMRELWVHECYMWVDFDDDGEAEYRRIFMIGDKIFDNEETDYQPIIGMSSDADSPQAYRDVYWGACPGYSEAGDRPDPAVAG